MSGRPILAALALLAVLPTAAQATDTLPDLDQRTPFGIEVQTDRDGIAPRFHLGFDSAVDNVGAGPLIVDAARSSTRVRLMRADQVVRRADGTLRRRPGIGALRFVVSPDHNHWHYVGFDRYELRRVSDGALVAPDQKTGFCLGDRYETDPDTRLPGEPPEPRYTSRCGLGGRELLTMREGISPGFGDDYGANLEGQFVDITRVATGRYYLVHEVNANRKLLESDYANNAASLALSITWPRGRNRAPNVKLLRGCDVGRTCPEPTR